MASDPVLPGGGVLPRRRWLVVGSYPPMAGRAADATVAAQRRIWAAGEDAVVASPRVGAAHLVGRVAGVAAGHRLNQLRVGAQASAVVLCIEPGMPWPLDADHRWADRIGRELARAMSRFARAEVVVTAPDGDLRIPLGALRPLWPLVARVIADSDATAAALKAAGAPGVEVIVPDPYSKAPSGASPIPGTTVLGPVDVTPRERPRQVISIVARRVLGRHAPAVRARVATAVHAVNRRRPGGGR
jgi:hypothetical protein